MALLGQLVFRPPGLLRIALIVLLVPKGVLLAATTRAVVIVPIANMYSAPTEDVDVISQAILGSTLDVLDEKPGWEKVRTADQYSGWMPLHDLHMFQPGNVGYATPDRVAQVSSLTANLYRETDVTQHWPILTVAFETRLEVIAQGQGDDRDWIQVPPARSAHGVDPVGRRGFQIEH